MKEFVLAAFCALLIAGCGASKVTHERIMQDWVGKDSTLLFKTDAWKKCDRDISSDGRTIVFTKIENMKAWEGDKIKDPVNYEVLYQGPGGVKIKLEVRSTFYLDEGGKIIGWKIEKTPKKTKKTPTTN